MSIQPPIPGDEPPENLYRMMVGDFEDTWNSVAAREDIDGRGNFMFARHAMGLLEFASRLCSTDPSGAALRDFTAALNAMEPRYFTQLPGSSPRPGFNSRAQRYDWMLPHSNTARPEREFLWAMFDMVRHGQAHQGQQIVVELSDGKTFAISLTGASYGRTLQSVASAQRPDTHLSVHIRPDGGLRLVVRPDILFLDFKQAISDAQLFNRGLAFPYLRRQATPGGNYDFDVAAVQAALNAGGHPPFQSRQALIPSQSRWRRFLNWLRSHIA